MGNSKSSVQKSHTDEAPFTLGPTEGPLIVKGNQKEEDKKSSLKIVKDLHLNDESHHRKSRHGFNA